MASIAVVEDGVAMKAVTSSVSEICSTSVGRHTSSEFVSSEGSLSVSRACSWQSEKSHMPRQRNCCVVVSVLFIVVSIAALTCYVTFDSRKNVDSWWDRFFTSERELFKDGPPVLADYDVGQWAYFIILCIVILLNLLIVVPAFVVVLRRRCQSVSARVSEARNLKHASVEAILPCYLPNEKNIVEETVWHILHNVESPGDFKLWLVYNTPIDMPEVEARLQQMAERVDLPHGRKLAVVRVDSSKSKAENINLILPKLTANYTVIYDADHHPDPESLLLMLEKIERKSLACVQGSTYIRNLSSGIMARIIDADFFVTHFIFFPCMRLVTRNAVFCGSNGLWQTTILQTTSFDPDVQTEDIDVSVRMMLERHTIDFCPEARSGELAPINFRALFKQRQRWAIGWDQVSLYHGQDIFKSDVPCKRKIAVSWLLYSRWLMQVIGLVSGVVTPVLSFIQRFSVSLCHCGSAIQLLETFMFYCFIGLVISCTAEAIFQVRHRGRQSLIQVLFVFAFVFAGIFNLLFQASLIAISLFKITTGRVGGWAITARSSQGVQAVSPAQQESNTAAKSGAELSADQQPSLQNKAADSVSQDVEKAESYANDVLSI